jgi:hypothetical protein
MTRSGLSGSASPTPVRVANKAPGVDFSAGSDEDDGRLVAPELWPFPEPVIAKPDRFSGFAKLRIRFERWDAIHRVWLTLARTIISLCFVNRFHSRPLSGFNTDLETRPDSASSPSWQF